MHVCAPQYRQCPQRPEGGVYLPELELQGGGGEDELMSDRAKSGTQHPQPSSLSPSPYILSASPSKMFPEPFGCSFI